MQSWRPSAMVTRVRAALILKKPPAERAARQRKLKVGMGGGRNGRNQLARQNEEV